MMLGTYARQTEALRKVSSYQLEANFDGGVCRPPEGVHRGFMALETK